MEDTTSHTLTIQTADGIVTMTAVARLVVRAFLLIAVKSVMKRWASVNTWVITCK